VTDPNEIPDRVRDTLNALEDALLEHLQLLRENLELLLRDAPHKGREFRARVVRVEGEPDD
jgi:hypothetical protein